MNVYIDDVLVRTNENTFPRKANTEAKRFNANGELVSLLSLQAAAIDEVLKQLEILKALSTELYPNNEAYDAPDRIGFDFSRLHRYLGRQNNLFED